MKVYSRAINSELLDFWAKQARPGQIALIHIDLVTAKLINWAEKWVTPDGEPSPWTHCFMFIEPREGVPWITESDVAVPLPGYRPKPSGPQENPAEKWALEMIDHAAIVDPGLSPEQLDALKKVEQQILGDGYTYRYSGLLETGFAMFKGDLAYRNPLHRGDSMHCGHYLRVLLQSVGIDPFGEAVLPENTVPDLFGRSFPIVAEWPGKTRT
jgi:hypothetical protein